MSFDEGELHSSLPLQAGQLAKLTVKVDASIPANLKIVLEERRVNSPDGGNFFPRFIQQIADCPDPADNPKPSTSFSHDGRHTRSLPKKPTTKSPKIFGRTIHASDRKNKSNTTEDVDLYGRSPGRRATSRYGSPQAENLRFSVISNSSSIDSLTPEADGQPQTLPVYKLASAEFELEYMGGPGADEGYYRKTKLCITVRVLPTFHFSHFDILPCRE